MRLRVYNKVTYMSINDRNCPDRRPPATISDRAFLERRHTLLNDKSINLGRQLSLVLNSWNFQYINNIFTKNTAIFKCKVGRSWDIWLVIYFKTRSARRRVVVIIDALQSRVHGGEGFDYSSDLYAFHFFSLLIFIFNSIFAFRWTSLFTVRTLSKFR